MVTLGPLALVDFFYNSQNDLAYCFTPWCRSQTKPLGSEAERALGQQQSVARCEHTATGAISSVGGCGIDECRESDGGRWTEKRKEVESCAFRLVVGVVEKSSSLAGSRGDFAKLCVGFLAVRARLIGGKWGRLIGPVSGGLSAPRRPGLDQRPETSSEGLYPARSEAGGFGRHTLLVLPETYSALV